MLQALIDAGTRSAPTLTRAVAFLVREQNPDGGFPQQAGGQSNAQSSAWAVQALSAAGRNVSAIRRQGSRTPLEYLESLQEANGSVRYSRTGAQTPVWVTAQALTALAGKPFPISAPRTASIAVGENAPGSTAGLAAQPGQSARSAQPGQSAQAPEPARRPTAAAGASAAASGAGGVAAGALGRSRAP